MKITTRLTAVLSGTALLAIGAAMTSFAAVGWAEEDGSWVYYDSDGDLVTDTWKKSGSNWYYLDGDGYLALDTLIEDDDNYYYVDINGVMATNTWVAIENEDAGEDDEPDEYWYYFQANGKALKQGDSSSVSLKTVNGKKYAFDEEGRMLYGWVTDESAERIDNSDGDAFKEGVYYFGDENDGAMTTGWILLDVTYDEATEDDYKYISPVFNEDEDQSRWFYFTSNGKKVSSDDEDETKEKTINGKKYAFDYYGAMVAEWSLDKDDADAASSSEEAASYSDAWDGSGTYAKYSRSWKYFSSVESGARTTKGWFKVVSAELLNSEKYDDDEDSWYYADGSGNIYAGEFKTINGKRYAFDNDGRMLYGLKFILEGDDQFEDVLDDDDSTYTFDNEDDFLDNAADYFEPNGYKCYYFGDEEDGSMRTGKTTLSFDGENTTFFFEKSGGSKGAGLTGEEDDKLYQSGLLLKADSDDKYIVVQQYTGTDANGKSYTIYRKLESADDFLDADDVIVEDAIAKADEAGTDDDDKITVGGTSNYVSKKLSDFKEAYNITYEDDSDYEYILVNTSGKIIETKSKNKDGNDYYFIVEKGGEIVGVYVED